MLFAIEPHVDRRPAIPKSIAATMTKIQWSDFTANSWSGCSPIPAASGARSGCDICYAKAFVERHGWATWGPHQPRHKVSGFASRMRRLNQLAADTGLHFSIFSLSLGDWLDPEVDPAWRTELIDTVEENTSLNWLLLTHRPHLIEKLVPHSWRNHLPSHIWPGVTLDHRLHARRWHELADHWASSGRAWISAEPLTSSLQNLPVGDACSIIVGGASNTDDPSWSLNPEWPLELVHEHGSEKVFFKQHGDFRDGKRLGKKAAGRDLNGLIYDRTPWPRHREMLAAAAIAGPTPNHHQAQR